MGLLCGLSIAFTGCASDSGRQSAGKDSQPDLGSALHQPLDDFNIDPKEIPAPLIHARSAPYAPPAAATCEAIGAEVAELDGVLGPDFDAPPDKTGDASKSRNAAVNELAHSAASSWIPFRGVVRWVTGADRHARKVAEAVLSGAVRRAYLKGLSEDKGCPKPSAPALAPEQSAAK